jgi:hypothetical protein
MEVTFTKEETIKLIEEYYKRLEDREVSANITSKKGYTGWQDEEACVTTVTISEKMEIAGMEKEVKEIITTDQLTTLLRAVFELYEFDLTSLTINDGLNSRWEGYGYNEHEVKSAYCKGIVVNVNKKKNYSLGKRPNNN